MPSPFPGMNPYLERPGTWHGFHEAFFPFCQEALVPLVRPKYFVKIDEHVYLHELPAEERRLVGRFDVGIGPTGGSGGRRAGAATAVATPSSATIPLAVDSESQSYLEIRTRDDDRLVTVIELLSPSNKTSDRQEFMSKRLQFLRSQVNYVEIDLLRGGPRLPLTAVSLRDYYVLLRRLGEENRAAVWTVSLRERLPVIPIPLLAPDADVTLDLQQLLHRIYDVGGYEDYIYRHEPEPVLAAEDAAWAKEIAAATRGL